MQEQPMQDQPVQMKEAKQPLRAQAEQLVGQVVDLNQELQAIEERLGIPGRPEQSRGEEEESTLRGQLNKLQGELYWTRASVQKIVEDI